MKDSTPPSVPFTTVAMAEILMVQDLIKEASEVISRLEQQHPDDERVKALRKRMSEKMGLGMPEQHPSAARGIDRIELFFTEGSLCMEWELTDEGLALAKRVVRYSGHTIIRLFTAAPGPRGVRTTIQDIAIELAVGQQEISGTATGAVFTAAIGFLGRNGAFVPMARALPVSGKK
ncbi:MAG: hypothetical protein JXX29_10660 [Deltaproteobacteria bacterium]|nr:hypothetical protein [Deltaproteobacteria bacterium]MBN2672129.1 hypothetical protein [Deltaproteobacteria bacterium]